MDGIAGAGATWWTGPRNIRLADFMINGNTLANIGIKIEQSLIGSGWARQTYYNRANRLQVSGCMTHGIWLIGPQVNVWDDIISTYNDGYCLRVECGDDTTSNQNRFNLLELAGNGLACLYFEGVHHTVISNSYLFTEAAIFLIDEMFHFVNCADISFDDSLFENVTAHGSEHSKIEIHMHQKSCNGVNPLR